MMHASLFFFLTNSNCSRSVKELRQPDDGISLSEKRIINQRALAAEKRSSIKVTLRSIYCSVLLLSIVVYYY